MDDKISYSRPGVISLYPHIKETKRSEDIPMDLVIDRIKSGFWQDAFYSVFRASDKKEAKKLVPYVTISGKFSERKDSGLIVHSNFLCIDVDNLEDPNDIKSLVCADKYVYACFTSISGTGLAIVFKINGGKHKESFQAIAEYLYTKYEIVVDQSGKDISRPRFVSYDPNLYYNPSSEKFAAPSAKKSSKVPDTVFVQTDFDTAIQQIVDQGIDITGGYDQWMRICFAIVDKFGEGGRNYFHQVSQFSHLYDYKAADRQYDSCLKAGRSGITISTLLYHAKASGVTVMSERTRRIVDSAINMKKARVLQGSAAEEIEKFDGMPASESLDIVNQVYAGDIKSETAGGDIEAAKIWLRENKSLMYNSITDQLESEGLPITEKQENDLWLELKTVFPKMDFTTIKYICGSSAIPSYHPIHEFFKTHQDRKPSGAIKEFCSCIESPTGFSGTDFRPHYVEYFFTKWLVGMVACAFGNVSALLIVLIGGQNVGKTELWRRLLPRELTQYFAQKSFSAIKSETGKRDLEIAMSQYWIISFDEMGSGATHQEMNSIKSLLSADTFKTRAAYGRRDKAYKRLAAFGATTNYTQILSDTTGNRRFIPIEITNIDKARKDAIDPVDILMEAYHLYKAGFDYRLSSEDIKALNDLTEEFQEPSVEHEMVAANFSAEPAGVAVYHEWTATEIKNFLAMQTKEPLNNNKLAAALKGIGLEQKRTGTKGRYYCLYVRPRS